MSDGATMARSDGATVAPQTRNPFIDALRGLAIILMALDHLLHVYDPGSPLRAVTRFAMPLFMVVAGYLGTGYCTRRYLEVVIAGALSWPIAQALGMPLVHILFVFALVYPLLRLPIGGLLIVGSIGLLQAHNWPLPLGGYQPGYVLSFLVMGRLAAVSGYCLPSPRFRFLTFELFGRYPLEIYVVHLALIFFAIN